MDSENFQKNAFAGLWRPLGLSDSHINSAGTPRTLLVRQPPTSGLLWPGGRAHRSAAYWRPPEAHGPAVTTHSSECTVYGVWTDILGVGVEDWMRGLNPDARIDSWMRGLITSVKCASRIPQARTLGLAPWARDSGLGPRQVTLALARSHAGAPDWGPWARSQARGDPGPGPMVDTEDAHGGPRGSSLEPMGPLRTL